MISFHENLLDTCGRINSGDDFVQYVFEYGLLVADLNSFRLAYVRAMIGD